MSNNDVVIQILVLTPDGRIIIRRAVQQPYANISSSVRRNGLPWQATITRTNGEVTAAIINGECNFYFKRPIREIGLLNREWVGMLDTQQYHIFSINMIKTTNVASSIWSETRLLSFDDVLKEMAGHATHRYTHHACLAFNQLLMVKRRKAYAGALR